MALPTSVDLLDRARAAIAARDGQKEPVSDYRVAKELGITRSSVSLIRNGKSTWGYPSNVKLAGIIGVDPRWLLAVVEVERAVRAQNEHLSGLWGGIAKKMMKAFFGLVLLSGLMPHPAHADVAGGADKGGACILWQLRLPRLLQRLLQGLSHHFQGVFHVCPLQAAL